MKKLLIVRSFFTFGFIISSIFLSFYIFQYSNSFSQAIIFNMISLIAGPFGNFIGVIISKKLSPNITNILGTLMYLTPMILVLISKDFILNNIILIGIIQGLASGLYFPSINAIGQNLVSRQEREQYNAWMGIVSNIISIGVPLLSSFIIFVTKSYVIIFALSLTSYIISSLLLLRIKINIKHDKIHLVETVRGIFSKQDTKIAMKAVFMIGLFDALNFIVLPLIILQVLSNILGWGIFNTVLSVFSIIVTFFFAKLSKKIEKKYIVIFVSYIFSAFGILLTVYYSSIVFFIFTVVSTLIAILMSVNYWSIIDNIVGEYKELSSNMLEYIAFQDITYSSGKFVILITIFLFQFTSFTENTLNLLFFIITAIPFIIGLNLAKSEMIDTKVSPVIKLKRSTI